MRRALIAALIGAAGIGFAAAPASASTFCVPDFSAACPSGGGNQAKADLSAAMSTDGSDGILDKVIIAPGTLTTTGTFTAAGSDPLEVTGAGRDKTSLTSSASGSSFVLELTSGNSREVTVKDLAIVIPASFTTGAAISETADHFESIDLITRNTGSSGVYNPTAGSSFTDIRAFGRNSASFGAVFNQQNLCGTGALTLDQIDITSSSAGLIWNCPTTPVSVNRLHLTGVNDAIDVGNGAQVTVTNGLIESGEGPPIRLYTSTDKLTTLNLDQVTVAATGDPSQPAIRARVDNLSAPTKNIEINLSNSIVTGFERSWSLEAPSESNKGNVDLKAHHSAIDSTGTTAGEAYATVTDSITETPAFVGADDFHLLAGSAGIDAGDPAAAQPTVDLDGNPRPTDGNGDGNAIRDMGAYELQPPPATCETDPSLCPPGDHVAPQVSKVKLRFRSPKGGALRLRLSEAASVKVTFRPVPKRTKLRRRVVKLTRKGKAGANQFKLRGRLLKPGRYKIQIVATDAAGNVSPVVRAKGKVTMAQRAARR